MMSQSIVYDRLKKYSPKTPEEERDALKEILQEIILCGLSDVGFFEKAVFQGGTSLRIFHDLPRFSEDLDFILNKPDLDFRWQPYLKALEDICKEYGIIPEVIDKSKVNTTVQKMFLKDSSIIKIINLSFQHHPEQKLMIKLEIDTNPPLGSKSEIKFVDFPLAAAVVVQDLPSNFAGKSHALLCRKYTKGRDWYDFLWYVSREIIPNFEYLSSAIHQTGPWAEQKIQVTPDWYLKALSAKIKRIHWQEASDEVWPFLNERDRKALKVWGEPFFLDRIEKLKKYIG